MPRLNVYLSDKTLAALKAYLDANHPGRNATSLTVEEAINEFLEKQKEAKRSN